MTQDQKDKKEMATRFMLSGKLHDIIEQSDKGEIALADFIEQLDTILQEGKEVLKIEDIVLQAKVDSYNAGYNKNKRRVFFCEQANENVIQEKQDNGEWLCLHDYKK